MKDSWRALIDSGDIETRRERDTEIWSQRMEILRVEIRRYRDMESENGDIESRDMEI